MNEKESLIKFRFPLSVHHIDYDKPNCKENNLILLCNICHSKTNYNRNDWKNRYTKFLINRGL